jgi:hypothetical protein
MSLLKTVSDMADPLDEGTIPTYDRPEGQLRSKMLTPLPVLSIQRFISFSTVWPVSGTKSVLKGKTLDKR